MNSVQSQTDICKSCEKECDRKMLIIQEDLSSNEAVLHEKKKLKKTTTKKYYYLKYYLVFLSSEIRQHFGHIDNLVDALLRL